jgi:ribosome maturation factor RimP
VTASAARLTELVTPAVTAAGYDLEDLTVTAAGKRSVVRVVVDKDGGVTLDDVADVSRALGDALDAADEAEPTLLGPSYVLEVSSPGVDRPLTAPRHWRRNTSRLVTAVLAAGAGEVTGRITCADDEAVVLDVDGAQRVLPYAELVRGAVQVEFSRKGAPEPDVDDVDDVDDDEGDDA